MRKIISKYEEEKKKRRNQLIVGGVLILVMFVSILGFASQSFEGQRINSNANVNTKNYNGFTFTSQNGFWSTTYKNQRLVFTYLPSEANYDSSNLTKSLGNFASKQLYFFSEDKDAQSEASINLAKFSEIIPLQNISSKDCSQNSIIIENNPISSIKQDNNCIVISGQGQNLIMAVDSVLFKIFGIKNG